MLQCAQTISLIAPMLGTTEAPRTFATYENSGLNLFLDGLLKIIRDSQKSNPDNSCDIERHRAFTLSRIVEECISLLNDFLPLFKEGEIPSVLHLKSQTSIWFFWRLSYIIPLIADLFSQPEYVFYFNLLKFYSQQLKTNPSPNLSDIKDLLRSQEAEKLFENPFSSLENFKVPVISYNPFQRLVNLAPVFEQRERNKLKSDILSQLDSFEDAEGKVNILDIGRSLVFARLPKDKIYYNFLEKAFELCATLPKELKDLVPFLNPEIFCGLVRDEQKYRLVYDNNSNIQQAQENTIYIFEDSREYYVKGMQRKALLPESLDLKDENGILQVIFNDGNINFRPKILSEELYRYEISTRDNKEIIDFSEAYENFKSSMYVITSLGRRHYLSNGISNENLDEARRFKKFDEIEKEIQQKSEKLCREDFELTQKFTEIAQNVTKQTEIFFTSPNVSIDYLEGLLNSHVFLKRYIAKQEQNLSTANLYLLSLNNDNSLYRFSAIKVGILKKIEANISYAKNAEQKILEVINSLKDKLLPVESLQEYTLENLQGKITANDFILVKLLTLIEIYKQNDFDIPDGLSEFVQSNTSNLDIQNRDLMQKLSEIENPKISILKNKVLAIAQEIKFIYNEIEVAYESLRQNETANASINSDINITRKDSWIVFDSWLHKASDILSLDETQQATSLSASQEHAKEEIIGDCESIDNELKLQLLEHRLPLVTRLHGFLSEYMSLVELITSILDTQKLPLMDYLTKIFDQYEICKSLIPEDDHSDCRFGLCIHDFEQDIIDVTQKISAILRDEYIKLQEMRESIRIKFAEYKALETTDPSEINAAIDEFALLSETFYKYFTCPFLTNIFNTEFEPLDVPSKNDVAEIAKIKSEILWLCYDMPDSKLTENLRRELKEYIQTGNLKELIQWTRENKPSAINPISFKTKWHRMRAGFLEIQFPQEDAATESTIDLTCKEGLQNLYTMLEAMKNQFGGDTICAFVDDLKRELNMYALGKIEHDNFLDKFLTKLHCQDELMHQKDKREIWRYYVANLVIGILTLGMALYAKYEHARSKQGFGELFFSKTYKDKLIGEIEKTVFQFRL